VSTPSSDEPLLLVLAGHDPTGGAGVDADREAARAFGVRAVCIVTAFTRQDGRSVQSIGARDPDEWLAEARALPTRPDAIKTGLLPGAEHVRAVARFLAPSIGAAAPPPVVVDPVLSASGGEPFLDEAGERALLDELLPLGVHLTPNLPEAASLAGLPLARLIADLDARIEAARLLLDRGAASVFLKGGHGGENPVQDLLLEPGRDPCRLSHPRIPGPGLHGSGCRTASAYAAGLARGTPPARAAAEAGRWVAQCIAGASGA
jgi:hydroxymethylpyrimidine/phosphomethylpyrimidine kinase